VIAPGFLAPLQIEQIDERHWRLLRAFTYDSEVAKARIVVPAGFVTDFASVPRVPVAYWLFGGTANAAAVIHDWLYTTGIFPKDTADSVFYEAMRASGIGFLRARFMYWGVAYGGGMAWAAHRAVVPKLFTV
jgi:hypothetical protein